MISVIIPYRVTSCQYRESALRWVLDKWTTTGTPLEVLLGTDSGSGPWIKAKAVEDAVKKASSEILVISDADVWCNETMRAVQEVEKGADWAVPHRTVRRLSQRSTEEVTLKGTTPEDTYRMGHPLAEASYEGKVGGGIVVLDRATYEICPMDSRFAGWGGEDESWGWALETLFGPPLRLHGILWHLWHPIPKRICRTVGSLENDLLRRQYHKARSNPDEMRRVIRESISSSSQSPDRMP